MASSNGHLDCVNLLFWNIHGEKALKNLRNYFSEILK